MEAFEDPYDLLGASTLADPVPLAEGRARPPVTLSVGSPPQRTCPMDDIEVDRDGNPTN